MAQLSLDLRIARWCLEAVRHATDATIGAHPSIEALAPLGQWGDARLKELVRRKAEEVRDAIEVFQRDIPLLINEDLAQPRFRSTTPRRQLAALLPTRPQERVDVLFQQVMCLNTT